MRVRLRSTSQSGPQAYTLFLNGAAVEVNARKLSDGGLLIQLNGRSHVTYAKVGMALGVRRYTSPALQALRAHWGISGGARHARTDSAGGGGEHTAAD